MIEARDVRMGQWGFSQPGLAPHPVHVRLRRAAVEDRRRRCARRCAGCTSAARSARATPATRTTARRRPGTSSARSASTRCRWAARTTRSARRCSRRRRSTSRTARTSSSARRTNSARNVYVQGLTVNGTPHDNGVPHAGRHRQRRHARRSTWARSRRSWATRGRRGAAVDHRRTTSVAAAAARRARRRQRQRDGEQRRRRGGLFDDNSGTRGRSTARTVGPVPLRPATRSTGALLHADVRHRRRGRGPARLGREGLQRRRPLVEGARRAQRRDVPVALADARRSSSRGPGSYALLPDRGHRERRRRVDDARRDRAAQQRQAVAAAR